MKWTVTVIIEQLSEKILSLKSRQTTSSLRMQALKLAFIYNFWINLEKQSVKLVKIVVLLY